MWHGICKKVDQAMPASQHQQHSKDTIFDGGGGGGGIFIRFWYLFSILYHFIGLPSPHFT